MRIGIDVRAVFGPNTGDRTYLLNLVRTLADIDRTNRYYLLTDRPPTDDILPSKNNFALTVLHAPARWMFTPISLPIAAQRLRLDVVHVQYIVPPICQSPIVATVHDVTFQLFPALFPPRHRFLLKTLMPVAMRKARRILTGSNQTKTDILRQNGSYVNPSHVVVTPYAPDPVFRQASLQEIERVKQAHGIDRPFILSVGVLQPRKNFAGLVHGFETVIREQPELPHLLCIAGKPGWGEQLRPEERIRFLGYVPDDDLPALYSGCDLFVFPSLYEGFGFTPLEAMACGAVVASSQCGSLKEVIGDAALTLDPMNVSSIAEAIEKGLTDTALRTQLREAGMRQVLRFSWTKTAEQTLAVYQDVVRSE